MPLGAFKAALMGTAGVSTDNVVLLATANADDDSIIAFTSDITSTYQMYIFKFYNIHGSVNGQNFFFDCSTDGGSNYGVVATTTSFRAKHTEDGSSSELNYQTGSDLAQGTGNKQLASGTGAAADESCAGELHLFNPSSTTYVKHYYTQFSVLQASDPPATIYDTMFNAGYFNTTSAINAIKFYQGGGTISEGRIKMWGVK